MAIYNEMEIFSNLQKYKSNHKHTEKIRESNRKKYRYMFEYKKYRNFKHRDKFLYNCRKCGFSTHTNDNYCVNCGSKMEKHDVYDEMIKVFNENSYEKTIKSISKTYLISMKNDYYFMNKCDGLLEAIFYVVTSHRFDKETAIDYLETIKSFKTLTQQLLLQDFKNKLFYQTNEIYGYISNWKGYKIINDERLSEVEILDNICEIKTLYCPPSEIINEEIYNMGIRHTNGDLRIGEYPNAAKLIFGEFVGSEKCPFDENDFVDDKLCMKLLAIASSWYYCKINSKGPYTPNKRTFWEFVWSCQLNPSDEIKLYNFVDGLVVE